MLPFAFHAPHELLEALLAANVAEEGVVLLYRGFPHGYIYGPLGGLEIVRGR